MQHDGEQIHAEVWKAPTINGPPTWHPQAT